MKVLNKQKKNVRIRLVSDDDIDFISKVYLLINYI